MADRFARTPSGVVINMQCHERLLSTLPPFSRCSPLSRVSTCTVETPKAGSLKISFCATARGQHREEEGCCQEEGSLARLAVSRSFLGYALLPRKGGAFESGRAIPARENAFGAHVVASRGQQQESGGRHRLATGARGPKTSDRVPQPPALSRTDAWQAQRWAIQGS